eukprot:6198840-Pleurochrysis_carterae.AAC.2
MRSVEGPLGYRTGVCARAHARGGGSAPRAGWEQCSTRGVGAVFRRSVHPRSNWACVRLSSRLRACVSICAIVYALQRMHACVCACMRVHATIKHLYKHTYMHVIAYLCECVRLRLRAWTAANALSIPLRAARAL